MNERYLWHIHQPQLTWSTAYRLYLEMLTLTQALPWTWSLLFIQHTYTSWKKGFLRAYIYVRWKNVRESGNLWGWLANKRLFALFVSSRCAAFEFLNSIHDSVSFNQIFLPSRWKEKESATRQHVKIFVNWAGVKSEIKKKKKMEKFC